MKKTDKKILEEIIRVDHAGERGAIKIYEGQLLALNTIKNDPNLLEQITKMKSQEQNHYNFFDKQCPSLLMRCQCQQLEIMRNDFLI